MNTVKRNYKSGGHSSRPGGRHFMRRKVCRFCAEKVMFIDYKNVNMLRNFVSERGKLIGGRVTGTCTWHQRQLTTAIKRARNIAFLPYAVI